MAINFPTSPSLNEEYEYNSITWVWTGSAWSIRPNYAVAGNLQATTLQTTTVQTSTLAADTDTLAVDAENNRVGIGTATPSSRLHVSGDTFLDGSYTEKVYAVTGTAPALSPTNGSIQTWALSGASTPTAGTWAAGQSITLLIDDGSAYTVTWTSLAVTWKTDGGSAPTLNTTGYTVIVLWKVGTTVYGARVGDA